MRTEPMLMTYLAVLEARGWVLVPTTRDAGNFTFFAHGARLLDRIQVFRGRWSYHEFDGKSWLTHEKARGDDAASLDAYLTKRFRTGGR